MKTEIALLLTYNKPIMNCKEVADLMGIGERTLENRIYAMECPVSMFKIGNKWHAHISDVAKYIDDQRAAATDLLRQGLKAA